MVRESILTTADNLVNGDRNRDYGKASTVYGTTAALWSVVLGIKVTTEQVYLCMNQVKIAREMNRHKEDNLIDIAGYAELHSQLKDEQGREPMPSEKPKTINMVSPETVKRWQQAINPKLVPMCDQNKPEAYEGKGIKCIECGYQGVPVVKEEGTYCTRCGARL